ncbi:MAG: D-hexose-6-phosphate mutarotase [Planctomycetes bacterium]|nr:D-hexose-6-phosphate mutarotase [Planctomycetota bacterium]
MTSGLEWVRGAAGDICLQGAHVTRASDLLFLSSRARFERGQAIRGGIPVIFPWFGDDPLRLGRGAHGFARRKPWRLLEREERDGELRVLLEFVEDEETLALWPHRFRARLEARFGADLRVRFEVENTGDAPFRYEEALHTYLAVGDVRHIELRGLESARYLDKLDGFAERPAATAPLRFSGPVDRVYLDTTATCELLDAPLARRLAIEKQGSRTTVVWNPWSQAAERMADLGDQWTRLVCVESANTGAHAIELAPGASHALAVRIQKL